MSDAQPQDPADNVEELREQIEHTREELAQTVEALTAKADVKGRAKEKAAEVTAQAKEKAAVLTAQAQEKATVLTAQAQEKATVLGGQAKDRASVAAAQAQEKPAVPVAAAVTAVLAAIGPRLADPPPPLVAKPRDLARTFIPIDGSCKITGLGDRGGVHGPIRLRSFLPWTNRPD